MFKKKIKSAARRCTEEKETAGNFAEEKQKKRNGGVKGSIKGSYTVEASMIIPIYLFMMVTVVAAGVDIYKEAESKQEQERVADLWMVDDFYILQAAGAVLSGSDQ